MTSKTKNFQVLAKSKPEISLAQHIDDCLNICEQLLLCFSHLPVQNYYFGVLCAMLLFFMIRGSRIQSFSVFYMG